MSRLLALPGSVWVGELVPVIDVLLTRNARGEFVSPTGYPLRSTTPTALRIRHAWTIIGRAVLHGGIYARDHYRFDHTCYALPFHTRSSCWFMVRELWWQRWHKLRFPFVSAMPGCAFGQRRILLAGVQQQAYPALTDYFEKCV